MKEQQAQREAQVVMYRQYRIGELPDIEISNSAIIAPIQALAMVKYIHIIYVYVEREVNFNCRNTILHNKTVFIF